MFVLCFCLFFGVIESGSDKDFVVFLHHVFILSVFRFNINLFKSKTTRERCRSKSPLKSTASGMTFNTLNAGGLTRLNGASFIFDERLIPAKSGNITLTG